MSEIKVNKISPRLGTDVTLGDSGDTFTIPSGATIANSGTATGFGDNLEWQSVETGATFTAVAGKGYPVIQLHKHVQLPFQLRLLSEIKLFLQIMQETGIPTL